MKCEHEKCTRKATVSNSQYFKDKWYCTFHGNKLIKEGRIKRKSKTFKDQWYNEAETTERMNIIGQNGNDGTHYDNK